MLQLIAGRVSSLVARRATLALTTSSARMASHAPDPGNVTSPGNVTASELEAQTPPVYLINSMRGGIGFVSV